MTFIELYLHINTYNTALIMGDISSQEIEPILEHFEPFQVGLVAYLRRQDRLE